VLSGCRWPACSSHQFPALCWSKVPRRGAAITAAPGSDSFPPLRPGLGTTKVMYGAISIANTAKHGPSLAGNITAIGVSAIIVVIWTLTRAGPFL